MAVPKKRTGKAKQAARRANWKGEVPATTTCPNCKEAAPAHTVCPNCGYYKDDFASLKNKKAASEAKEEKPKKTRAKKAKAEPKTEETKETVKEEAKAEAKAEEIKEETVEEKTEE